jgi:hypothetical protein
LVFFRNLMKTRRKKKKLVDLISILSSSPPDHAATTLCPLNPRSLASRATRDLRESRRQSRQSAAEPNEEVGTSERLAQRLQFFGAFDSGDGSSTRAASALLPPPPPPPPQPPVPLQHAELGLVITLLLLRAAREEGAERVERRSGRFLFSLSLTSQSEEERRKKMTLGFDLDLDSRKKKRQEPTQEERGPHSRASELITTVAPHLRLLSRRHDASLMPSCFSLFPFLSSGE